MVEKRKKDLTEKRVGPYVHQSQSVRGIAKPVIKRGPNGFPTVKTSGLGPNGQPKYTPYDESTAPRK